MIVIDCSELSADEKLALAMQVSDRLDGTAIALVKGENIVLDEISDEKPERSVVKVPSRTSSRGGRTRSITLRRR